MQYSMQGVLLSYTCLHINHHLCLYACVFLGAVPVPESLLFSPPALVQLEPVSSESLMKNVSPAETEELRKICKGSMQCVYDTLASGSSDLGLQTLDAEQNYENLAMIYGNVATLCCNRLLFPH